MERARSGPHQSTSESPLSKAIIAVVRLSSSFGDVWRQLSGGLEAEVRTLAPGDVREIPRTAAVVLAAGGAEREAMEWLDARQRATGVPVLVVGADSSRRVVAQAVSHGATDYFALPDDAELLRNALNGAVARWRDSVLRNSLPGASGDAFARIAGESPVLKAVLQRAARVANHPHATALIAGETGTGKELLARAVHDAGPRRGAPFVPVNCSALPRHLIESELFGHEKGAFTDAHAAKPGLFEVADGGTLFLDEVGTLPVDLQAKLLRVLDDREVRRVGATKSRRVDVRIVAATNEDLRRAVHSGEFRQDLFFRLSVVTLELPPLRARGEDVLVIARKLLKTLGDLHGVAVPTLTSSAQKALRDHNWPGNIRELKNALERALLLSPPGILSLGELLPDPGHQPWTSGGVPSAARLDEITAMAARTTLEACGGNVSEAARRLNVSRARLRRLIASIKVVQRPIEAGTI